MKNKTGPDTNNKFMARGVFWVCRMFLLLAVLSASGCEYEGDMISLRNKKTAASPTINIGVVWPLTSTYKSFVNGVIMASDEINLSGGILGKKLKIYLKDDESSVTKGMVIADEMAADPEISAAVGFCDSYVTIPVSGIYDKAGILMITTSSVDPSYNSFESPLLFRTTATAVDISCKIAELIDKLGFKNLSICYVTDNYGLSSANAFEDELQKLSISVVDRRSYSSGNAAEFKQITDCWKLLNFDCAVFFGYPSGGPQFIESIRREGILAPIFCGDTMNYPDFIKHVGQYSEGIIVTSLFNPLDISSAKKSKFVSEYKNRFGILPDTHSAQAYDAMKLLAEAIKRAGRAAPPDIAKALRSFKKEEGVVNNYEFDEKGEALNEKLILKIVKDKKFIYLDSTNETDLIKNILIKRK